MYEPKDPQLAGLVQGIAAFARAGAVVLIDKDYQIRHMIPFSELGVKRANQARSQMLGTGDLLAIVMSGLADERGDVLVCEHYPAPGQVETYTLSVPRPCVTWTDQDDPDVKGAVEAFKETWSLDRI